MNLLSPTTIRDLCARAKMRPQRSAGQHYLIDARVLNRIVDAVDPRATDTILEIGAGFGVLTTALGAQLKKRGHDKGVSPFTRQGLTPLSVTDPFSGRIIALEREYCVIPILKEIVAQFENVEVVEGDVLTWLRGSKIEGIAHDVPGLKWKLVANLPYGITSDFLRLVFDRIADGSIVAPERIVLLLQREVVDRMIGASRISVLTILTQLHGAAHRIVNVPPSAFWPPPKVESAVIALDHIRTPNEITELLHPITRDQFLTFVRIGFAHPRRQLLTNLSTNHHDRDSVVAAFAFMKIKPDIRPSALSFAQWVALARKLIPSIRSARL